ncbi:thioredoxin [Thermoplasmatota archaeon]
MDNQLNEIKRKKLEEMKKKYFSKGEIMSEMPNKPINITDADLDENIKKYTTIVVDCWAPWCGPCRMVGPIIDELAKEMEGKIVFGKLNVDENQLTSTKYQIMSIPSLLVFKNGKLVDKFVGALPKEMLIKKLDEYK